MALARDHHYIDADTSAAPDARSRDELEHALHHGCTSLGDFPAGALIGLIGGPLTVVISAAIVGSYTLFLLGARPVIRGL